jgi:mannose-1-phosphate guanylyltransferase
MMQSDISQIGPGLTAHPPGGLWGVVLAGGEGRRLQPLIRRIYGEARPKQYAALIGTRSLLRQTLDRVALGIAPARTVIIASGWHSPYFESELRADSVSPLLAQPFDRGTAAGVLLPAHWISWRDPTATVAIFPSDHFIGEDSVFMDHVLKLARAAPKRPDWITLLGAQPTGPETEYGWIEPGASIDKGSPTIWQVRRFQEKPSAEIATASFESGCLWNTFVMVAPVATLIEAGRRALPELHALLSGIEPSSGTGQENDAIREAYAQAPTANFSASVLACPDVHLAVSELPPLVWSDWGTPGRVLETFRRAGISPSWYRTTATA